MMCPRCGKGSILGGRFEQTFDGVTHLSEWCPRKFFRDAETIADLRRTAGSLEDVERDADALFRRMRATDPSDEERARPLREERVRLEQRSREIADRRRELERE